jgi:hypothetical protein
MRPLIYTEKPTAFNLSNTHEQKFNLFTSAVSKTQWNYSKKYTDHFSLELGSEVYCNSLFSPNWMLHKALLKSVN